MSDASIIWGLAAAVVVLIVLPYARSFHRRVRQDEERKAEAVKFGFDRPTAQYPYIDPARCIGCGACVDACPEGDVLGIVLGTATVINGLRCVGHAACEKACPVDAIEVGLGDIKSRADIPLLDDAYQTNVPGIYIVGELGGLALIRYAVRQGREVIESFDPGDGGGGDADAVIVGAGPAGLSAALAALAKGMRPLVLDQEESLGGTILHYPRRKLVLTQPVELPLWGWMNREEYTKEELLELFQQCVERFDVPIRFRSKVVDVRREDGLLVVQTQDSQCVRAPRVVLATGRRGSPRKLGVPGEELPKVTYRLLDADSYRDRDILVVGGGDSAVEAAIGLARNGHNRVWLSYRKPKLVRVKQKNQKVVESLIGRGHIQPVFESNVLEIQPDRVLLDVAGEPLLVPNDYVFIFIGGEPPFGLLRRIGVRFGGEQEAAEGAGDRAAATA